ncbi:unnamed protein product [Paramecium octaurelia]|uniref:Uncharacterized protein n=1 Tax=Paramecium octaurelia TaxID=43137 RepID=A0A8S1XAF6_PAROT|nr:unnamed protein product [Paramecium octaurelia]
MNTQDINLEDQRFTQQNNVIDFECFDIMGKFPIKEKFKIIKTNTSDLLIVKESGIIIRSEMLFYQQDDIPINFILRQIHSFQWVGNYEEKKKVGTWSAKWNNQALLGVGGQYCNKGKKQGLWKEIFKNYSEKSQVYEEGLYKDDLRVAIWNIFYENNRMYYLQKFNQCQWWRVLQRARVEDWSMVGVEQHILMVNFTQSILDSLTCSDNQLLYFGEYLNGQKINSWESLKKRLPIFLNLNGCKKKQNQPFEILQIINNKSSKQRSAQISYCGEYRGDKKFGVWDFYYQTFCNRPSKLIGGGVYDEQGCKTGKWVEPCEQFTSNCWLFFEGQYRNGIKVGKWEISCQKEEKTDTETEKIGYGLYDDQGLKEGVWLELDDSFCSSYREVIYQGDYWKNHKIGKWEIKYKRKPYSLFEPIAGGSFDEQGQKIGVWRELTERFSSLNELIYQGQYDRGVKIGQWEILFRSSFRNSFDNIGCGGSFNQANLKNGMWIEQDDDFSECNTILHIGQYQDGLKVGCWNQEKLKDSSLNIQSYHVNRQQPYFQRFYY